MKTSLLLLLLLVTILMHEGTSFPSERRGSQSGREKYASWDDVNIVAHGILQLGQGLKEHVDKAKVQMRDVNAKLKVFNSTVAQLERASMDQSEALRTKAREMEERERLAEKLADEVRVRLEEMKAESQGIHARMNRLEGKVDGALQEQVLESNNSDYSGVPFIQRMLEAQNKRIDDLVEKLKHQQDKLEKQSMHLETLQSKVAQKRLKSHRRRDEETALKENADQHKAPTGLAADCHELFLRGQRDSGVYTIQPLNSNPFHVLCEMTSEGGWTIIQRRQDGSQNFNQLWEDYRRGFGNLNGEFWLGLENIHSLSKQGQYTLQVEFSDWRGRQESARYQFRLDGEEQNYALHLDQASSGVLDSAMTTGPSGLPFSTPDRDNDLSADINCAKLLSGGWWFSNCGESNLNGKYPRRSSLVRRKQSRKQRMFWNTMKGHNSMKATVLKIIPVQIKQ